MWVMVRRHPVLARMAASPPKFSHPQQQCCQLCRLILTIIIFVLKKALLHECMVTQLAAAILD